MKKTLLAIAIASLELSPSLKEVHCTPDGKAFVNRNAAVNHCVTNDLKPSEVEKYDRSCLDDKVETLSDMTVAVLKGIAKTEEIDLGKLTKKDDIVAEIEKAREAKDAPATEGADSEVGDASEDERKDEEA